MPARENVCRNLILNQHVASEARFMDQGRMALLLDLSQTLSRSVIVAAGSMLTVADRYASLSVHQEQG
jgi:hypothetical protein